MANGYGSSSSSSSSSSYSSSSGSSSSYSSSGEVSGEFIKTKDGVAAPLGFHYMPNGKLMNDADHIAKFGYMEKKIRNINVDLLDISPDGGEKTLTINGDNGFIFSLEIYEGDRASYYNFKTNTWSSAYYKQTNSQGVGGAFEIDITFPEQSTLKTFTINVYAETAGNIKTTHGEYVEIRNPDGNVNVNLSTGSDSNVVTKILYQDVIKNLYISTFAPSKGHNSTATVTDAFIANRMLINKDATDRKNVGIGDLVVCTGITALNGLIVTKVNPDGDNVREIQLSGNPAAGVDAGVEVTFNPAFRGITPNDVSSTTGRAALEVVSGSSGSYPFLITFQALGGRGFRVTKIPTIDDLCAFNTITFGASPSLIVGENIHPVITTAADNTENSGTTVNGGDTSVEVTTHVVSSTIATIGDRVLGSPELAAVTATVTAISGGTGKTFTMSESVELADDLPLSFSNQVNYKWPVSNIANLNNGMLLDPARTATGLNTTTPASIGDYKTTKSLQKINKSNRYYTDFDNYTEIDLAISAITSTSRATNDRNGRVTAQTGDIIFSRPQVVALNSDANVRIIAQGASAVLQATGAKVSFSDITITPTQVSTTTTAASSASTTIAVTEAGNIVVGQLVRGVGMNSAVANPTVVSKSAATGAANIVVSSAQTLEDGVTLFFDGLSKEHVMRGTINVTNAPIADTTLYFNVEGFLTVS